MKYNIVITYKNGSTINIEVPENYYQDKYYKKPDSKIHKIFIKEYRSFVEALNRSENVVNVNKYLSFSNATVSAKDILGIDLKTINELQIVEPTINVPGVHDKTYLDISETSLDIILKKLETTNLIENLDIFIKKVNSLMSKNNVEIVIKAGGNKKKPNPNSNNKKYKLESQTVAEPSSLTDSLIVEEPNLKESTVNVAVEPINIFDEVKENN